MARFHRSRSRVALAALGIAAMVTSLSACGSNNFRDVNGIPSHNADTYTLWNNLDANPNLVRVCADGVAFLTTSRPDFSAVQRIPQWDAYCRAHRSAAEKAEG